MRCWLNLLVIIQTFFFFVIFNSRIRIHHSIEISLVLNFIKFLSKILVIQNLLIYLWNWRNILFSLTVISVRILYSMLENRSILIFFNGLIKFDLWNALCIIFMVMLYCSPNCFFCLRFVNWVKFFIICWFHSIGIFDNSSSFNRRCKCLKTVCSHLHFLRISIIFFRLIFSFVLNNLLIRWNDMSFWGWSYLNFIKVNLAFY
jgi:hypothetical protein